MNHKEQIEIRDEKVLKEAVKRAEARLGFYIHSGVALGVIILLAVINLTTQTRYLWFKWPALGLGLSLVLHWLGAFKGTDGSIRRKMVRAEIKKLSGSV